MRNYLTNLNFKYDEEILKLHFENADYVDFKLSDPSKAQNKFFVHAPGWQICRNLNHIKEVERIVAYFETLFESAIRSQFFKQMAGCEIPYHHDGRPKCSINILLSENNAPITFEDIGDVYYTCALLDVKKKHMIRAHNKDRWLFNLSILEKTYDECIKRLPNSLRA